jgi:hypothetical protein
VLLIAHVQISWGSSVRLHGLMRYQATVSDLSTTGSRVCLAVGVRVRRKIDGETCGVTLVDL